jgi:hypothetical protein
MPLTSYEAARPWARAIREEVLSRRMPKWHAARGYGQFANDRSLTPFEIALVVAWVDGDAIRGPRQAMQTSPPQEARLPPRENYRTRRMSCGERTLPAGRLLGVKPQLAEGGSAGIGVVFPDGRREVIAWIRDYERKFAETYWLRTPLDIPRGARLQVEAQGQCQVAIIFE